MVISVKTVSEYADTNAQGDLLFDAMYQEISSNEDVMIDFQGISNVTSSFVNSSFVRLLEVLDFSAIQKRVQISGANRQIATMIKSRMHFEAA